MDLPLTRLAPAFRAAAVLLPAAVGCLGAAIMAASGSPVGAWRLHLAALLPGVLFAGLLARFGRPRLGVLAPWLGLGAVALVLCTLLFPGPEGVRRWLPLGPAVLHASALGTPWVLFACAQWAGQGGWWKASALSLALQLLHYAQPDAGQAAALALGFTALWLTASQKSWLADLALVFHGWLGFRTWAKGDSLAPVPHVEGIVDLGHALGGTWAIASQLAPWLLAGACGVGAWMAWRRGPERLGWACVGGYFAGLVAASRLGHFPVPVLGFGLGPLVGAFTALGLAASGALTAQERASSPQGSGA